MSMQLHPKAPRKDHPAFDVVKNVSEGVYIVRRITDGEQFIGHAWNLEGEIPIQDLRNLLRRGAEAPAWAVLNHENLMSIVCTADNLVFRGSGNHPSRLLLWDFADAGNLAALFTEKPRYPAPTGFLPESLCWHVTLSMLKALAWLHEGYRRESYLDAAGNGAKAHGYGEWKKKEWIMDSDWMPILHRNITPANIFFQHPKGSETYGLCKLGNFGKVFVSGHVNGQSGGPVATVKSGAASMKDLRKAMAADDIYKIPKRERPYTKGTELYKLGTILYRMMTGKVLPPEEECNHCGCRHMDSTTPACRHAGCHEDIDLESVMKQLTEYTDGLKKVLSELLSGYRGSGNHVNAITCLKDANSLYKTWKYSTPDGKIYVDWIDDLGKRWLNVSEAYKEAVADNDIVDVD